MKNRLILLLASAAVAAGGCSENETPADSDGYGTLRIACRTDAMITTRAEIAVTPVPDAGDLSLTISGTEFSKTWESLSAFNDAGETIPAGSYTAELRYGDPKAEGVGKVCYYGSKAIEIVARQRVEETIPVQIANAQVLVSATESFLNYFHDATFTVTTSAGNRFTFTPGAETADEAVFVEAGTTLTLTGTAKLQSQTGTAFDRNYAFPEQRLDRTVARTRHTFLFDARDNGSATLTINLDDGFLDERTIDVELNDDTL
ncbi:MAG TPA: DUF4493 domain-containing protein [Candidatus Alistipes cottocaccae]|nr:DUF4493 domain-containing protein [Candidatus Alistipes cottocaccae]